MSYSVKFPKDFAKPKMWAFPSDNQKGMTIKACNAITVFSLSQLPEGIAGFPISSVCKKHLTSNLL